MRDEDDPGRVIILFFLYTLLFFVVLALILKVLGVK